MNPQINNESISSVMMNIALFLQNSAKQFPFTVAMKCEDEQISYEELDQLVNRYCSFIVEVDAQKKGIATVLAYKSIDAVAFSQAALRCGMPYTVIDPRYPDSRIASILEDSSPRILFTDIDSERLHSLLTCETKPELIIASQPSTGLHHVRPEEIREIAAYEGDIAEVAPDDLAYILYTSGSTGVPKGVKISHGNARYSIEWAQDEFKFEPNEVFLNQAHFGFDFCVIDHYNAWHAGATIILVPEYNAVFPAHVVDLIREEGVTNLWLVPSNITALIKQGHLLEGDSSKIKRFLYGGEPFQMNYLRQVFQWINGKPVYNLYGPTETNLVTAYRISATDLEGQEVPLGKAIPGTTLMILDESRTLSRHGKGELCTLSPSVALGYTNRPDLNKERFITTPEGVWYHTGDMVSIDEDGTIWFCGRVDEMVKIRGYRIELKEIEMALTTTPGVIEAALLVHEKEETGKEVHAFCVKDIHVSEEHIRRHLSTSLPKFMMPRYFHFVSDIPYNDRGKINRGTLTEMIRA